MSHLTSCEDSRSTTSSPVSASGLIPSASLDGLTISQYGQAPARASLSARQAKEMGLLTSGTYGRACSTSSASADLSMSLASRLQAVTQTHGSTLYKLTWKEWATPSGLCRLRQRASVRRTSESGPTGWPTPTAASVTGAGATGRQGGLNIQTAATLAGWPTPAANEFEPKDLEKLAARRAKFAEKQGNNGFGLTLGQAAPLLTGWVTPTSRDWKDTSGMAAQRDGKDRLDQLPRQAYTCGPLRLTVFGEMRTGSFVAMENGAQLNPAHSRWLMGLPRAWDECSPHWQEWQAATEQED